MRIICNVVRAGWLAVRPVLGLLLCAMASASASAGTSSIANPAQPPALQVDDRASIKLWPSLTLLVEAETPYRAEDLVAQPNRFHVPAGTPSNLGRQHEAVWLRVPLQVSGVNAVQRVLEFDYPALSRIDVGLWRNGQRVAHHRLGNHLALADRPLATRSHAVMLDLQPGHYVLLMRVESLSSLVLPITLRTNTDFVRYETRVHLTQGVMMGLMGCMLLYSLAHGLNLRDTVFLDYAMLLVGSVTFGLGNFGIGAAWLWTEWPELSMSLPILGVLVGVFGGARFTSTTLAVREISVICDRALQAAGVAAVLAGLGFASGLLGYRAAQGAAAVLSLLVIVFVLPAAARRALRGETVAIYMLMGWAVFSVGVGTTAAVVGGLVEPTFWTQHIYPLCTVVEMVAWMAVLGQRVKSVQGNAERVRLESETLRTMAHTDALTGLPNRRGLSEHLEAALRQATPRHMLAVYMLDLDGFKPVNDRFGHDVGDALLVAVGQRLQAALRSPDVVARLGGDEFVVLVAGLKSEQAAYNVGTKLLATCNQAFEVAGQRCEVGLTIGYALAPLDGNSAQALLKQADAAMYTGKQQGRKRMQRGERGAPEVAGNAA